ncbi:MAG: hypothetical protein JW878_00880 [Methanomicrobia archaeon]|nr:hypothetical protein [Methanomicrobia archaeon]
MSLTKLLPFLKFLESEADFGFDVTRFEHRLMLQKYVYIAKFLGLQVGYSPTIYLRGPYSPSLAQDYYKIAKSKLVFGGDYKKELGGFKAKKFLELIGGKGAEWLEVAGTILSLYQRYKGKYLGDKLEKSILSTTCDIKSFLPEERISKVFADLRRAGMIII